jgi:hypothetical protein
MCSNAPLHGMTTTDHDVVTAIVCVPVCVRLSSRTSYLAECTLLLQALADKISKDLLS